MGREPLIGILSLVSCLTHLSSASSTSLRSSFRNSFILDPFCSSAKNCGSIFPNRLCRRIYKTKFPTHLSCHFSSFYLSYHYFTSTLKTFLLFETVAMLSRYQPAVNCSSGKVERNFTHKAN